MKAKIRELSKYKLLYLLLLPGFLYLLIWHYIPLMGSFIAFKDVPPYAGLSGMFEARWVGFKHFNIFFSSRYFLNILLNTVIISFYKIVFGFPVPIILALMLNEVKNARFKKVTQTISYLPHFISMVVVAGMLNNILSVNGGIVNAIIKTMGKEPIFFLGDEKYFRSILVLTGIWQGCGWESIIYLAAITSVDPQLYEAATIDGASKFRQIWSITIPSIMSVVTVMLIMKMGSILSAGFEQILLLYSPSVYNVADIIDTYVYREGILSMKYSFATAVGLFKSVVGLMFIIISNYMSKKFGQEGLW